MQINIGNISLFELIITTKINLIIIKNKLDMILTSTILPADIVNNISILAILLI
ncbi:hypothetical protein HMPREF9980_07729 [Staphylococcus epidermidis NIHLM031]|nr:hypothetical protein HMPREF9980_07729 [Staphylococcus epidermidis NIHLM031]